MERRHGNGSYKRTGEVLGTVALFAVTLALLIAAFVWAVHLLVR